MLYALRPLRLAIDELEHDPQRRLELEALHKYAAKESLDGGRADALKSG